MDIQEFQDFISKKKRRKRSRSPLQIKKVSPRRLQLDDLDKRLEAAKEQAKQAQRDDCTVLVLRLHIKADQRDVYNFFSAAGVGKVRDVRIIRDPKTNKSKGVAYVQFYTPDAVLKSMTLSGQMINGQHITVQPSQAQKNRAALANKVAKAAEQQLTMPKQSRNKIYVAGLRSDKIGNSQLRELFESFGTIESTEISRGIGYIQFKHSSDARSAIHTMDRLEYKGRRLRVGMADTKAHIREAQRMGDHQEDGNYIHSKGQKNQLMNKLRRH